MLTLIPGQDIQFRFRTWREEWETRHALVIGVVVHYEDSNHKYPEDVWFLRAWDIERGEHRDFPLSRIDLIRPPILGPFKAEPEVRSGHPDVDWRTC